MALYEDYLRDMLSGSAPEIASMAGYVMAARGKAVRPLIVMLSAGLFPDSPGKDSRSRLGATLVEMAHNASLIHDDVVDRAYIRRSSPSVNALWGDHLAVLLGDYLLARCFSEGIASGQTDIVERVSRSLYLLCEGEVIQSRQSDRLEMTREIYLDITRKKTALLISTASAVGAVAASAPQEDVDRMALYGEMLGMAFQIRDDILDYAPASQTGKPAMGDLRERKINMPLLAIIEKASAAERRTLLGKLSDVRRNPSNVEYLHRAVVEGRGIEEASASMEQYLCQARSALAAYPTSECRESLAAMCDYVAGREK